jgi:hypothetical protein
VNRVGADVGAATAAGAASILVPTAGTHTEEIAAAPPVVRDFAVAVDLVLGAGAPDPAPMPRGVAR